MTIEKGRAWGSHGPLPPGGVLVRSDAEARTVVERARRAGGPPPPLGLLGGDLCRTLGGTGDEARLHSDEAVRVSVDIGSVLVDGRLHWFLAHLVARRSWWRGRLVAVMNAQWVGTWNVAPRAHPNDGELDVVDVEPAFGLSDRLAARSRMPLGTHVPHPKIATRRAAAVQLELRPELTVYLDGAPLGRARNLSVRIEPDAVTCVV